jgi:hypothetical protein
MILLFSIQSFVDNSEVDLAVLTLQKFKFLFQPHVPVRLPCYDFILVTNPKMTIHHPIKKLTFIIQLIEILFSKMEKA